MKAILGESRESDSAPRLRKWVSPGCQAESTLSSAGLSTSGLMKPMWYILGLLSLSPLRDAEKEASETGKVERVSIRPTAVNVFGFSPVSPSPSQDEALCRTSQHGVGVIKDRRVDLNPCPSHPAVVSGV